MEFLFFLFIIQDNEIVRLDIKPNYWGFDVDVTFRRKKTESYMIVLLRKNHLLKQTEIKKILKLIKDKLTLLKRKRKYASGLIIIEEYK